MIVENGGLGTFIFHIFQYVIYLLFNHTYIIQEIVQTKSKRSSLHSLLPLIKGVFDGLQIQENEYLVLKLERVSYPPNYELIPNSIL